MDPQSKTQPILPSYREYSYKQKLIQKIITIIMLCSQEFHKKNAHEVLQQTLEWNQTIETVYKKIKKQFTKSSNWNLKMEQDVMNELRKQTGLYWDKGKLYLDERDGPKGLTKFIILEFIDKVNEV